MGAVVTYAGIRVLAYVISRPHGDPPLSLIELKKVYEGLWLVWLVYGSDQPYVPQIDRLQHASY